MDTAEKLKIQESARYFVYRGLADAFRPLPSDLSTVLKEVESALIQLDSDACDDAVSLLGSYLRMPDTQALAVDHAGLFVGPFLAPAPPYGSVYLEDNRRLMGDSTIDARQHYRRLCFDLSSDFKEAPDHICAELEFMQVLISRELEAIDTVDYRLLLESIYHQKIFLEKHIGAWIPTFTGKMIEHARTGYYRHLAAVTRTFIAEDLETLSDLGAASSSEAPTPG